MNAVGTTVPPSPEADADGGAPGDGAGPPASPDRRWSRGRWFLLAALLVLGGLVAAAIFWRTPYYMLSPGSVRDTESYIAVSGAPSYSDDAGTIDYLTVSVKQATPIELLGAWIDPAVEVVDAEKVLGKQSPEENRNFNLQLMAGSKDAATYQALSRLGYDIPTSGSGAVVASVASGVPAADVLSPGDTIVRADGQPVQLNQDLVRILSTRVPGDVVTLEVQPLDGGDTRTVTAALVARPDDPSRPMLGVSTFTRDLSFQFPVQVTIDSGRVGGPSAGLAFTLGVLDALTPGSLTGGAKIATTGTMEMDGRVGAVGGVHQKVVAAKRAGVDLMLVPSDEVDEARKYADGLRIEPVDDLNQALDVLTTLGGGNAVLPPAPAPAAG